MIQPISQHASPHLAAAGAAWDDGPEAGLRIAERLGPFGDSVGHAVPLGYPAYAVAPLWPEENSQADRERGCLPALEAVCDVLERFTGDQPMHSIAGTAEVIDALVADRRLNAFRATPADALDGDD